MRIGFWWVSRYTMGLTLGGLFAVGLLWWRAPAYGLHRRRALRWLWLLACSALGLGRIVYVWINGAYFAQHPEAAIQMRRVGGVNGVGAWIGALCITWLWSRSSRRAFRTLSAWLAPAALCLAAGAWWACLDVGCAWGLALPVLPVRARWLAAEAPDLYHTVLLRYAVQRTGALWSLSMAALSLLLGPAGGWALVVYGLGASGLALLRADPMVYLNGLRLDFVFTLSLAILLALGLWLPKRVTRLSFVTKC